MGRARTRGHFACLMPRVSASSRTMRVPVFYPARVLRCETLQTKLGVSGLNPNGIRHDGRYSGAAIVEAGDCGCAAVPFLTGWTEADDATAFSRRFRDVSAADPDRRWIDHLSGFLLDFPFKAEQSADPLYRA